MSEMTDFRFIMYYLNHQEEVDFIYDPKKKKKVKNTKKYMNLKHTKAAWEDYQNNPENWPEIESMRRRVDDELRTLANEAYFMQQ